MAGPGQCRQGPVASTWVRPQPGALPQLPPPRTRAVTARPSTGAWLAPPSLHAPPDEPHSSSLIGAAQDRAAAQASTAAPAAGARPKADSWVRPGAAAAAASAAAPCTSEAQRRTPLRPAAKPFVPREAWDRPAAAPDKVASEWVRGQGEAAAAAPRRDASARVHGALPQGPHKRKRPQEPCLSAAKQRGTREALLQAEIESKRVHLATLKAQEAVERSKRQKVDEVQQARQHKAAEQEHARRAAAIANAFQTSKAFEAAEVSARQARERQKADRARIEYTSEERAAAVQRVLGNAQLSANDVLQVGDGASIRAIKDAYKALSLLVHPDKCAADGAVVAFQRVKDAYTELIKDAA